MVPVEGASMPLTMLRRVPPDPEADDDGDFAFTDLEVDV